MGLQDDMHTWALSPQVIINNDGDVDPDSSYIWISHLYTGPAIADHYSACTIDLPLNPHALVPLINHLKMIMGHNFYPSLLVLGATAMATHYSTILGKFLYCPVPFIYGHPGTGKSTVLRCGLSILGCAEQRFFSKATKEKYASLCSESRLPLVIDDPRSQNAVGDLVMTLYNGACEGTVTRGHGRPSSMAMIGANFTTSPQEQLSYSMHSFMHIQ